MQTDHLRKRRLRMFGHGVRNTNNRGQTLVEYVLIVVVISIVLIAAMQIFQGKISSTYSNAASSFPRTP